MRIAFCWDWNPTYEQTITWQDGLSRALLELFDRGHDVKIYVPGLEDTIIRHPYFDITQSSDLKAQIQSDGADVILHFADMTRPNAKPLRELGIPMAICFAGGEPVTYNTYDFQHIFVESQVYKEAFEKADCSVSIAFGTNTDLFAPMEQPRVFDTIFPATFAAWKRHDLYAQATRGLKSLAVGWMYQDHEQECWEECVRMGTTVLPHVSAEALHYLYAASRLCVITSQSNGGSQRTVLEAMAMNMPLIVTDSDRFDFANDLIYRCDPEPEEIRSYINAILDGDGDVNTRDYILNNWSHVTYANALEEGLMKICR